MLSRDAFHRRFGDRPVFGMVHLLPLPGAPLFRSMEEVLRLAVDDARAIEAGGCAGLIVENFGDRPFARDRVAAETVAAMTRAIAEVMRSVSIPVGVNVLRNDPQSALAIASATGAAFIRVNVHTGTMVTDQGIIEGDAYETLRLRARLAPEVLVFADHLVKHAVPLAPLDAAQSARDLRLRGLADALIVTGSGTGEAADPESLATLRSAVDAPLLVGSGVTAETARRFAEADALIVGTGTKRDGRVDAPVDRDRVAAIVKAFSA